MTMRGLARLFLATPLAVFAQATDPNLANFGWFAELRGACWRGEHPDRKTTDTQCYSTQYDRLLRGTIKVTIEREGGVPNSFEGDSVYAFDPARKVVVFTQWGSNGSYGTGQMVVEGQALRFTNRLPDGSESRTRSVWRRVDADTYRVTRERREGDGWKASFEVEYRRAR
ncbi:MAG TPA: hypothetical protein VEC19_10200 [Usitatibacter sp.]|nr:hypothetical protein [Usitatibacter sp.]